MKLCELGLDKSAMVTDSTILVRSKKRELLDRLELVTNLQVEPQSDHLSQLHSVSTCSYTLLWWIFVDEVEHVIVDSIVLLAPRESFYSLSDITVV
jgi:hypothetical protein